MQQLLVREGVAVLALPLLSLREQSLARVIRYISARGRISSAAVARHLVGGLWITKERAAAEKKTFSLLMLSPPRVAKDSDVSGFVRATFGRPLRRRLGIIHKSREG